VRDDRIRARSDDFYRDASTPVGGRCSGSIDRVADESNVRRSPVDVMSLSAHRLRAIKSRNDKEGRS